MQALAIRAGPAALQLIRERGLRPEDIDILPGASGGAKWLVLAGLDRFLFGTFLAAPRSSADITPTSTSKHTLGVLQPAR